MQQTKRIIQLLTAVSLGLISIAGDTAGQEIRNPYFGEAEAIEAGRTIYAGKCYGCHHSAGARGPNLFVSKLTDEQFLDTVINGRKNTQMPAFGERLTPDEVWQVHAFIKSTDHY